MPQQWRRKRCRHGFGDKKPPGRKLQENTRKRRETKGKNNKMQDFAGKHANRKKKHIQHLGVQGFQFLICAATQWVVPQRQTSDPWLWLVRWWFETSKYEVRFQALRTPLHSIWCPCLRQSGCETSRAFYLGAGFETPNYCMQFDGLFRDLQVLI